MNESSQPYIPTSNTMLPAEIPPHYGISNNNANLPLNPISNMNPIQPMQNMNPMMTSPPLPNMNMPNNMNNNITNNIPSTMSNNINNNIPPMQNMNPIIQNQMKQGMGLPPYPMNQIPIKEEKSQTDLSNGFSLSYNHKLPHEERQLYDGSVKNVGIVIKQSSFLVIIVSQNYPLERCNVDCTLIYDNAELSEAHYINQKPISFNSQINNNNTMNVELRISVLSSSHEDMLFRVRFDIYNAEKEKIATLYSDPLRVISKADSSKKKTKQHQSLPPQIHSTPSKTKSPRMPNCFKKEAKKEQREKQVKEIKDPEKDNILQTLQYQQTLLKEISQHTTVNPLTQPLVLTLNYYLSLPHAQRINQLIQFISELTPQESLIINELMEVFRTYKKN